MKKILLLLLPLFVTSCATLVNKQYYEMEVASNVPDASVQVYDTTYALPARIAVKRSREDLTLRLAADTINKNFTVASRPGAETLYGNAIFLVGYPVAFLADLTTERRFTYGKSILLDVNNMEAKYSPAILRRAMLNSPVDKGTLKLTLSIPWINSFYLQPQGLSAKNNTGFFGISGGLEYYYKTNRYIKLNTSAVTDFFLPVPAAVTVDGPSETFTSVNISLTHNHNAGRFSFGYGPAFASNLWTWNNSDSEELDPETGLTKVTRINRSLGASFNGYYRLTKSFYAGLLYNTSFYSLRPEAQFNYEHVISLDLLWKINLKR